MNGALDIRQDCDAAAPALKRLEDAMRAEYKAGKGGLSFDSDAPAELFRAVIRVREWAESYSSPSTKSGGA